MPNLIQVPGQVNEFLSDGNTSSVPFIQASDIGDGDLLNATATIEEGNGYKFRITLPSGRFLESAPVGSDYPKRDAIMQWLGAVREAIVEDAANAGRAARDAALAESSSGTARPSVSGRPAPVPESDPVEYAKQQLRGAIERLAALSAAEADVAKWQRVVNSLTGESDVSPKRKKRRKKRKASSPREQRQVRDPILTYTGN